MENLAVQRYRASDVNLSRVARGRDDDHCTVRYVADDTLPSRLTLAGPVQPMAAGTVLTGAVLVTQHAVLVRGTSDWLAVKFNK